MIEEFLEHYNYWTSVLIIFIGLYTIFAKNNLLKKLLGLSLVQTGIFLFFISLGDIGSLQTLGIGEATPPIIWEEAEKRGYLYVNPLPHVLILTGIVVAAATTCVALALLIRIYKEYKTLEEDEIIEMEVERGE
ncbi:MAG: cation:proton antiporter subunit C [Archaeoglobaceae archaeon]|nr:cation:proton antiporter subunit C [Archaeoglobaceae archaeon]MCX8152763.1 cation:proton antiporter subunit C [Archaeoglobaceae archaeon]MDW8013470.1 cation:proton antiporter subunit C [Archaeoglobaceae archaeon]